MITQGRWPRLIGNMASGLATKKAQLNWRVDQWRDQVKTLIHANYQWFALIKRLSKELEELESTNEIFRTPITVRQFLLFKWPRADLLQTLRDCANHYPQNVVITRRTGMPARNAMLEFIEKQHSVVEVPRDHAPNSARLLDGEVLGECGSDSFAG